VPIASEILEFVDAAGSSLTRADMLNASSMAKNAETFLRSAWQYVVATPSLESSFDDAIRTIRTFAREVDAGTSFGLSERSREAQSAAITAVEQFRVIVANARANDLAQAMGLAW
jgi:hypothetical protein